MSIISAKNFKAKRFTQKNLSIKEGCLVCLVCFVCHGEISRTVCPPGRMLGTVGKLSARRGARAWFRGIPTNGEKVIEFQSFSNN